MALAWFVCGYTINPNRPMYRNCAMDGFSAAIQADGGDWSESEVLGGYAVVKVRASDQTLSTIAGTAGFQRIPNHFNLSDTLGDLTNPQKTAIYNRLLAMGYTDAEIQAAIARANQNWSTITLGQVLRFAASRRLLARWDDIQSQIVLDGAAVACRPVADVDGAVQ